MASPEASSPTPGTPTLTGTTSLLGAVIDGDYQIVRLLGSGGMGQVYEAKHVRLPRRFAVKVIRRELLGDSQLIERFRREAEVASSLGSAHIVDVLDFNILPDGTPFMVMELLEGEDLGARLSRLGRLSLTETRTIVMQLAEGLSLAHQQGIIHRDIKPENIFLSRRAGVEAVKLLDFGLSKVLGSRRVTLSHTAMGTPLYMSPEQVRGDRSIDHRTDIYSVGVVLYQLLTGVPPFEGDQPFQVFSKITSTLPTPPLQHVPHLLPEVSQLILLMLEKNPDKRPQTMSDVAQAFSRLVIDPLEPVPSFPPGGPSSLPVPTPSQMEVGSQPTAIGVRSNAASTMVTGPQDLPEPSDLRPAWSGPRSEIGAAPGRAASPPRAEAPSDVRRSARPGLALAAVVAVAATGYGLWSWRMPTRPVAAPELPSPPPTVETAVPTPQPQLTAAPPPVTAAIPAAPPLAIPVAPVPAAIAGSTAPPRAVAPARLPEPQRASTKAHAAKAKHGTSVPKPSQEEGPVLDSVYGR